MKKFGEEGAAPTATSHSLQRILLMRVPDITRRSYREPTTTRSGTAR